MIDYRTDRIRWKIGTSVMTFGVNMWVRNSRMFSDDAPYEEYEKDLNWRAKLGFNIMSIGLKILDITPEEVNTILERGSVD